MPRSIRFSVFASALLVVLMVVTAIGITVASAQSGPSRRGDTMEPLRSDAELRALLRRAGAGEAVAVDAVAEPMPPPPPAPSVAAPAEAFAVGTRAQALEAAAPGITNVQTAGVDEGGIVKTHGRHLVVLRRGRLFTIDVADARLRTVDHIDAFPPGDTGRGGGAWYDEMLVTGDTVVVIGFSYARGGTEINRFRISDDGRLTYVDTHHLRSNDYYSADNYASRLIGTRLIIYTPLSVWSTSDNPLDALPAIRRWSEGGSRAAYERIAMARNVYVADLLRQSPKAQIDTLHSVMSCDLAAPRITCRATVVPGSYARTFYVGQDAVYVWTGDLFSDNGTRLDGMRDRRGLVYRMPLDGSAPQAAVVWGGPVDQFGLRSEPDGTLHALVRSEYLGDSMWLERSRQTPGALALLTLPRSAFGRGSGQPDRRAYRALPPPQGFQLVENRFIGDYLVYGGSNRGGANDMAYAVALASGEVTSLPAGIAVSRIDRMGNDAILIGSDGNALSFQSVALGGGRAPAIVDRYDLAGSSEGESRSQAFFFRPDNADGTSGVLGLPVARSVARDRDNLLGVGSGIFYMTRTARRLAPAGQIDALPVRTLDDGCVASCIDWYGNARPVFLGNRIFALMGYELVEGRLDRSRLGGGTIREVQRLDFAPRGPQGR